MNQKNFQSINLESETLKKSKKSGKNAGTLKHINFKKWASENHLKVNEEYIRIISFLLFFGKNSFWVRF